MKLVILLVPNGSEQIPLGHTPLKRTPIMVVFLILSICVGYLETWLADHLQRSGMKFWSWLNGYGALAIRQAHKPKALGPNPSSVT